MAQAWYGCIITAVRGQYYRCTGPLLAVRCAITIKAPRRLQRLHRKLLKYGFLWTKRFEWVYLHPCVVQWQAHMLLLVLLPLLLLSLTSLASGVKRLHTTQTPRGMGRHTVEPRWSNHVHAVVHQSNVVFGGLSRTVSWTIAPSGRQS